MHYPLKTVAFLAVLQGSSYIFRIAMHGRLGKEKLDAFGSMGS